MPHGTAFGASSANDARPLQSDALFMSWWRYTATTPGESLPAPSRDVEAGDSGHAARLPAAEGDERARDQDEEHHPDQYAHDAQGRLVGELVHGLLCGRLLVGIGIIYPIGIVPRPDLLLLQLLGGLGLLEALSLLERHWPRHKRRRPELARV
eukprot:scaffold32523_cov63-Phaeocystis_antarctica.AAC.3